MPYEINGEWGTEWKRIARVEIKSTRFEAHRLRNREDIFFTEDTE